MSFILPIYLNYIDIYNDFTDLYKIKQTLIYKYMDEFYLNEDNLYDVFDSLQNIIKFSYKISLCILNKDMYLFVNNDITFLFENYIISQMNTINIMDDQIKDINKKIIGLIMYENKSIKYKGRDLYRLLDTNSFYNFLNQLDIIINNLSSLIRDMCSVFYYNTANTLDNKNNILYSLIKDYFKLKNLDFSTYKQSIINDYQNYIFYENCYQSLIYNGLILKNKKNINTNLDFFINYIRTYVLDFDEKYFINYTMDIVNKIENDYVKNINLEYFFNSNIFKNQCSLNENDYKKIFNIIFDDYIFKYNYNNFYKNICKNLNDNILKYNCNKYNENELEQLIQNFTNDDDKILTTFVINSILNNENIFFKKYKNIINDLYNFIDNIIKNSSEYFFEYIEIIIQIYNYKKDLIENGNISMEINNELNKIIKSCIISINNNYDDFSKIISLIYKNSLTLSFYDPIEFMVKIFEKFITIVSSVDYDFLENTNEYILFNDLQVKNIFVEKDKNRKKDVRYYLLYFDDIKRLNKFIQSDNNFLRKINKNYIIGKLKINLSQYYDFPILGISILNFIKIKLKINDFQKNVILLGETHTKTPFNYQYIQNELNICRKENKYIEFLLELTIHLYYVENFKQKLNIYNDEVYNLSKYSPCISDKILKNVYSDITLDTKDNVFCFDNVWYQNIDYRTANLIYSYIFNSNFNKRGKERILAEKGKAAHFDDINGIYIGYFYYMNTIQYLNYTYKNFIFENKYILFGNVFEYSKEDQLYKILESSIYLSDFKQNFKIKLKQIIDNYNEKISYIDSDDDFNTPESYLYNLNLYISDKTLLYKELSDNIPNFDYIKDDEIKNLYTYIDTLTVYDIYKVFILQITDYYNYIYNTYINLDVKVKSFILSDPENIYGYRIFKFIKNFTDNFDKNAIKNVLSSFIIRIFNINNRYDYTEFISMFTNYHFMFCKYAYFDNFSNILIRDSLIDINILNRIFFKYDEDDKLMNNFPTNCKNILVYAGATHTLIVLIYLTNSFIYGKYRNSLQYNLTINNLGIFKDSLISINDFINIYYQDHKNEKIMLPSISSNFE